MSRIVPTLNVSNAQISRAFYVDALGFAVDWQWPKNGEGPVILQLSREGATLYLTEHADCETGGLIYLYVDDVDQCHKVLLEKSIGVDRLPQNKPWGNREMQVSDPDGNKIRICTPT